MKTNFKDTNFTTSMKNINCINLDQLIETIKLNKNSLSMKNWITSNRGTSLDSSLKRADKLFYTCGTLFCIAGFAAIINKEKACDVDFSSFTRLIGCNNSDSIKICSRSIAYKERSLKYVKVGSVIALLEELLKRALKAQNIDLVTKK